MPWPNPAPRITWRTAASAVAGTASRTPRAVSRAVRRMGSRTPEGVQGSGRTLGLLPLAHRVQAPFARHAAQLTLATILEADSGPDHEILHRAGDEHLVRPSAMHHPRSDVHCEAAEVAIHHLELARVQSGAHLQPQRAHRLGHRGGAADRPRRSVEGREEAVAGALDLPAAMALERLPEQRVVALQQETPAPVAHLRRPPGGLHDVGEHHRRQHAVRLALVARAREELLDLSEEAVGVADREHVVAALQLHVARARDLRGDVAGMLDLEEAVLG